MATADDVRRVVWVLGAGFSRALGGPLLPNLLSDESEGNLGVRYPSAVYRRLYEDGPQIARAVFAAGLAGHERSRERLWTNAEEFIDYVDTAADPKDATPGKVEHERATGVDPGGPNPHRDRIRGVIGRLVLPTQLGLSAERATAWRKVPMDVVRSAARRLIAAECCAFLESVDTRSEQWRPFRSWASALTANDTIISFNYDRVVETLRDALVTERGTSPIQVVAPDEGDEPATWNGCAPLFKLHGSVDWRKVTAPKGTTLPERIVKDTDPRFALKCADEELAIATPGPSKMRESRGALRKLWQAAKDALRVADAIVFVGFRFPETDAFAREELLGSIAENVPTAALNTIRVHTVLGLDRPSDSSRLVSLLDFAARKRRDACQNLGGDRGFVITRHPLYAQDFFSVAKRADAFR
jgi:hypothetical protein